MRAKLLFNYKTLIFNVNLYAIIKIHNFIYDLEKDKTFVESSCLC